MAGSLLRTGNLKAFHPLGAVGNPVYLAAPQLRVAIARRLGERIANSFALPQRNEDGDTIDWYAADSGPVVPWSAASPEERSQAREQLLEVRTKVQELAARMQQEEGSDRQVFGRLLEHVTSFPDDQHVYLVNGRPVITFWGFHDNEGALGTDPLLDLELARDDPKPEPKKRRMPWWLWLLLLLLLIGLGLLLLRSCQPPPAAIPEHDATASAPPASSEPLPDADSGEQQPITELTGQDPAEEEEPRQLANETDAAYAERLRSWVERRHSSQDRYNGSSRNDSSTVTSDRASLTDNDTATTSADAELNGSEPLPGEDTVIDDEVSIEGEDQPLPGDQPAMDEPTIDEPLGDGDIDPNAQPPEESPSEPSMPEEPPTDAADPLDPNAQPPEQPPEQSPEQPPEDPQTPEDASEPPADEPPAPEDQPQQPPADPEAPPAEQPGDQPEDQPNQPADAPPPEPPAGTTPATPPPPAAGNPSASSSPPASARRHRYSSGNWRPSISLQDPRNGLPLKMEYDMQDGSGKVKLRRSDGSVCSGGAASAVQGGQAVINATSDIRCPDGSNFGRPSLECPPGQTSGKGCVVRYSPSDPGVPVGDMKPAP